MVRLMLVIRRILFLPDFHEQKTACGARFLLGFSVYLILAQTDPVYLILAFALSLYQVPGIMYVLTVDSNQTYLAQGRHRRTPVRLGRSSKAPLTEPMALHR